MRISLFYAAGVALLLASCSEFNKAVKSTDVQYKYKMAVQYFEKPDFDRAMPLFEELLTLTRGDTLFEPVSFYYAMGNFGQKDYIMASYYLENFAKTFHNNPHAEQCSFLAAYCHYMESPEYELDQADTQAAIDKLELFMVRFPDTNMKDSANVLIDELRAKLEMKDYTGAKQYLRIRDYSAASVALQGFLVKWPNSPHREEALFSIFVANHDLALNSVDYKRERRNEDGIRSFNTFADAFPESSYLPQARTMLRDLTHTQKAKKSPSSP